MLALIVAEYTGSGYRRRPVDPSPLVLFDPNRLLPNIGPVFIRKPRYGTQVNVRVVFLPQIHKSQAGRRRFFLFNDLILQGLSQQWNIQLMAARRPEFVPFDLCIRALTEIRLVFGRVIVVHKITSCWVW